MGGERKIIQKKEKASECSSHLCLPEDEEERMGGGGKKELAPDLPQDQRNFG